MGHLTTPFVKLSTFFFVIGGDRYSALPSRNFRPKALGGLRGTSCCLLKGLAFDHCISLPGIEGSPLVICLIIEPIRARILQD